MVSTFNEFQDVLDGKISDAVRKNILDGLGIAGSNFRSTIYEHGFKNLKKEITKAELLNFFNLTKKFLDHTIAANKREDNLYHSYNLMNLENENGISISHLNEMLEGQVAILSSGNLSSKEALKILDGLKHSDLFRPDQYSYLLYPNKDLPRFIEKNKIPYPLVESSELLKQLLEDGNAQIIEKDELGNYHFNGNFNNSGSLDQALTRLSEDKYQPLIEKERMLLLNIFEKVFDHRSFTGRSGTFFGYEGLGSIYWHMVSKLLLAVQEVCLRAIEIEEDPILVGKLLDHYYEINEGIGVHKSPELYGAFPTDPYSHTPAGKGAQQPGMTGQVKEDILCRFGELGVFVRSGKLQFRPQLLRRNEFLKESKIFRYTNVHQKSCEISLGKDSLCFTYCQIPIIYKLSDKNAVKIKYSSGSTELIGGHILNAFLSNQVFSRDANIEQIQVDII